MPQWFPPPANSDGPESEVALRRALAHLGNDWVVFSNLRWLEPSASKQDAETDFVLLHPIYGLFVLEVKGGMFAVEDGAWWRVDGRGKRHAMGIHTPLKQAVDAKHRLRRRLDAQFPELAQRYRHIVAFPDGFPAGDLGADAPGEILVGSGELLDIETRLIAAAAFFSEGATPDALSDDLLQRLTKTLAPRGSVDRPPAREAAAFRELSEQISRDVLTLTARQLSELQELGGRSAVVVHGAAGTGKTVLSLSHCRQLLRASKSVLVVVSSPQLASYYRYQLQDDSTDGDYAVIQHRQMLDGGAIARWDALVVDEAQLLSTDALAFIAAAVKLSSLQVALFCDIEQIRRQDRRTDWTVPFDHDRVVLTLNLRNSTEIGDVLEKLGYRADVDPTRRSGSSVEALECRSGAHMRGAVAEVVYDLVVKEGLRGGQVGVISEAPHELAALCGSLGLTVSTDTKQFGIRGRDRIDFGIPAAFRGLERDIIVLTEPTFPTSPPVLRAPSGASSLPRSSVDDPRSDEDLQTVLRLGLSRAQSRAVLICGPKLRQFLNLPLSDRSLRSRVLGSGSSIEVVGIRSDRSAVARASRRHNSAQGCDSR